MPMPDKMSECVPDRICQIECEKGCQIKCQIECEIECQIECEIECEIGFQIECQTKCQSICQIECLNICQIECQIECQKECGIECQIGRCQSQSPESAAPNVGIENPIRSHKTKSVTTEHQQRTSQQPRRPRRQTGTKRATVSATPAMQSGG